MSEKNHEKKERDFLPNVRIVLEKHSTFIQPITIDVASPLYGKIENGTDDSAGYDERKYQNSVMRHSPLFERMRNIRRSIEKTKDFYDGGELYSDSMDDTAGESELYCDGMLFFDEGDKILRLDNDEELVFHDGLLFWRSDDPFCPELVFENGKRISHAYFPHLDFILKLGAQPELSARGCVTIDFCDSITEEGGTLSLEYVVELSGVEFENTKLTLTVYPFRARL